MVSIGAHGCPTAHKLNGFLEYLAGYLGNERGPGHTFRQRAHGFCLGLGDFQSERSTHCSEHCHHLCKDVIRYRNNGRVVCIMHFPDGLWLLHGLLGVVSFSRRPLRLLTPPAFLFSLTLLVHIIYFTKSVSAFKRSTTTGSAAVKTC